MPDYQIKALNDALRRLGESPALPAAVRHLKGNHAVINVELGETVLAQIPAFTDSRNPEILPELSRHGPQHTDEILRLLNGGEPGDFAFVREHSRRHASQRFPLEATLHAYRCGQKVFSRWMRRAALTVESSPQDAQQIVAAVADFAMEYTDAISTIAAGAYLAQTRLMADVAGDQRAELLTILLDGYDESDGRVANILRSAGYLDTRQSFCIALAQPVVPAEMQNPARASPGRLDRRDFAWVESPPAHRPARQQSHHRVLRDAPGVRLDGADFCASHANRRGVIEGRQRGADRRQ